MTSGLGCSRLSTTTTASPQVNSLLAMLVERSALRANIQSTDPDMLFLLDLHGKISFAEED